MRPASAALISFLESNNVFVIVDLFTFVLADGTTLRYSGYNTDLTLPSTGFPASWANFSTPGPGGSVNYSGSGYRTFALGPSFGRTKVSTKVGVEPTELTLEIHCGEADRVGNLTFQNAFRMGVFDKAIVELDRWWFSSALLEPSLGAMVWFYGRITDVDAGRTRIDLKVKSLLNDLELQQMPPRIWSPSCQLVFGGVRCGYNREDGKNALGVATGYGAAIVLATSGTTQSELHTSFLPTEPTAYTQGSMECLTGANTGQRRVIKNSNAGVYYQLYPWLYPVIVGDTFKLLPGCPRTVAACNGWLNNFPRYGGMPYVPPPELAA